jgi:AcrR family transcriptional regulator
MARNVLIESGVERVKVEPLAMKLGVTTGSFYHHFENRDELLRGLLEHWERSNSGPLFEAVKKAGADPDAQIDALFEIWSSKGGYDPAYDSAVRAWAHASEVVEAAVHRVDEQRIDLLTGIFSRFGYDKDRAFVRARLTYFHQIGYQALQITESPSQRKRLAKLYREVLVGNPAGSPGRQ